MQRRCGVIGWRIGSHRSRHLLRPLLAERNIDAETDLLAFRRFLDLAIQFAVHAFDAAEAEKDSSAGPVDFEALMAKLSPSTPIMGAEDIIARHAPSPSGAMVTNGSYISTGHTSLPISSFVDGFLEEDKKHVSGGTAGQKTAALKLLVRIVGDIPADSITRKDVKRLHDTLQVIPISYGKSPEDAKESISKIIAGAEIGKGTMAGKPAACAASAMKYALDGVSSEGLR